MPLRTRCGTSRLPCMSLGVRAQGLGPRGGGTALAITICSVLPSVPYDAVVYFTFAAQYPARTSPCQRFAFALANNNA